MHARTYTHVHTSTGTFKPAYAHTHTNTQTGVHPHMHTWTLTRIYCDAEMRDQPFAGAELSFMQIHAGGDWSPDTGAPGD